MFKVGDKVVHATSKYRNYILSVNSSNSEVTTLGNGLNILEKTKHLRHATPQEIALGHRIDLEELRGCDISPNCKKFEEQVK